MMYSALTYSFISFLISIITTPFFCKLALRLRVVDAPDGKIKVHEKTTPYLGGIVVFLSMIVFAIFTDISLDKRFLGIILGSIVLVCVGLIDDIYTIKPIEKIFGQNISAIIFIFFGNHLIYPPIYAFVGYGITFLWFITIMNAINLVDIMDGLAGVLSLVAFISFGIIAYSSNNTLLLFLCSSMVGGLIGFLYYNKPRAKIYLGDAGSLFLGGILGSLPFVVYSDTLLLHSNIHEFLTGTIILGVSLMETILLIIIRTYKKIPFYRGSPDHFACYLKKKNWSEYKILLFVFVIGALLGLVAHLFFFRNVAIIATLLQLLLLLFFSIFMIFLNKASI